MLKWMKRTCCSCSWTKLRDRLCIYFISLLLQSRRRYSVDLLSRRGWGGRLSRGSSGGFLLLKDLIKKAFYLCIHAMDLAFPCQRGFGGCRYRRDSGGNGSSGSGSTSDRFSTGGWLSGVISGPQGGIDGLSDLLIHVLHDVLVDLSGLLSSSLGVFSHIRLSIVSHLYL